MQAARAATPVAAHPRRRGLAAPGVACLLGLSLLTPPGQAAIEKVRELIGIGDVGDPPSLKKRFVRPSNTGVIVASGYAPDGIGYEWTAFRADITYEMPGKTTRVEEFCVGFDWRDRPGRGGPVCSAVPDASRSLRPQLRVELQHPLGPVPRRGRA